MQATATDAAGHVSVPSTTHGFTVSLSYFSLGCSATPASQGAWAWLALVFGVWIARSRRGRWRGVSLRRAARPPLRRAQLATAGLLAAIVSTTVQAKVAPPETSNPYIPIVARLYEDLELQTALATLQQARAHPGNRPEEHVWLEMMDGALTQLTIQGTRTETVEKISGCS